VVETTAETTEITAEQTEEIVANSTEETTDPHPNNPSRTTTGPVQNAQTQTLHFGKSATNVMPLVRVIQQVKAEAKTTEGTAAETTAEATEEMIANLTEGTAAETTAEVTEEMIANLTEGTAAETTAEATEEMIANLTEETAAETTAEVTEVMIVNLTEEMVAEIPAGTTVQLPKKTLHTTTGPVQNVQTQILVSEKSATNVMHLVREVQERGMLVVARNREINAQIKEGNENRPSNTERQRAKVQITHITDHQRKLGIEDLKMMIFEGLM
jgi:hypothetical protein